MYHPPLLTVCLQDRISVTPFRAALQRGSLRVVRFLAANNCRLSNERYLFKSTYDDVVSASCHETSVPQYLQDAPQLLAFLRTKARNPPSLLQRCLSAVRQHFQQGDPPFSKIRDLPLPTTLIAKLCYEDVEALDI